VNNILNDMQRYSQEEGKYLIFRGPKPFPPNSKIYVTIGPDIPSVEGPLLSPANVSMNFTTTPALTVTINSSLYGKTINFSFNQIMASSIDILVTDDVTYN
jgi:hypothetical protein